VRLHLRERDADWGLGRFGENGREEGRDPVGGRIERLKEEDAGIAVGVLEADFLANVFEELRDFVVALEVELAMRAGAAESDDEAIIGVHFNHGKITELKYVIGDLGNPALLLRRLRADFENHLGVKREGNIAVVMLHFEKTLALGLLFVNKAEANARVLGIHGMTIGIGWS
jgi:hypothetical protein